VKEFWYCYNCTEEVLSQNVTFNELHDRCGHPVERIQLADKGTTQYPPSDIIDNINTEG